MRNSYRHKLAAVLSVTTLLLCSSATLAQNVDIRILQKALRNALGEKTNIGTRRVIALREELKEGRKTLVVGVIANDSPTPAGLRHGVFSDVVKVLGVLKSWDWPSKIEQTMIGEYYAESKGPNMEARPVLMCVVSSETIRDNDWNAFDPGKIPEILDNVRFDDMLK